MSKQLNKDRIVRATFFHDRCRMMYKNPDKSIMTREQCWGCMIGIEDMLVIFGMSGLSNDLENLRRKIEPI